MTTTNQGDQIIIPDYRMDADSPKFMRRFESIIPTGIYSGLDVTQQGNDVVISPGVAEIKDSSHRQVRIRVQNSFSKTPTPDEPWVLLTWEFNSEEDWWADFITAQGPKSTDIRLAEASFDANDDLDSLDLTVRDYPEWSILDQDGNVTGTEIMVPEENT